MRADRHQLRLESRSLDQLISHDHRARALWLASRLCQEHDAYRWITGGLEICHRVLSDFRVRHGDKLDTLLTELLAALMKAGVITLRAVAQDGTRVRASAGAASFRREKSLKKCLREAKQQVRALKTRLDDDDETTDKRKRAAREREESVSRALEALKEVKESHAPARRTRRAGPRCRNGKKIREAGNVTKSAASA